MAIIGILARACAVLTTVARWKLSWNNAILFWAMPALTVVGHILTMMGEISGSSGGGMNFMTQRGPSLLRHEPICHKSVRNLQ